jgi:hypothetical protein
LKATHITASLRRHSEKQTKRERGGGRGGEREREREREKERERRVLAKAVKDRVHVDIPKNHGAIRRCTEKIRDERDWKNKYE